MIDRDVGGLAVVAPVVVLTVVEILMGNLI